MWRTKLLIPILLISIFNGCDSQVVNINNTWILPQQGFNVFYRFFRDKISWYEADAVCQFHHGNLVTVDNSLQFDTTRNFLKLLNVTQSVWIGLRRPQNSKVFAWQNSMTLASTSGYWAESLPLIDSPLCAVIDPARDFRWHAFRCGGPITASFLCELKIPNWAKACIPSDTPSLAIQYLADSGVLELTQICGNGRSFQRMCRTKEDLNNILKELPCKINDRNSFELSKTHIKSLEIIKNISSDNNEDNNINTQPSKFDQTVKITTEKNQVQKLIDQFNVEDMMQADQPQNQMEIDTSKVNKKPMKKVKSISKKIEQNKKMKPRKTKVKNLSLEEMMMGDEPVVNIEEAQEPLPHIKKSFTQDLKHHLSTTEIMLTEITTEQMKDKLSSTIDTTTFTKISTIPTTLSVPNIKSMSHPMHGVHPRENVSVTSVTSIDDDIKLTTVAKETSDNHFIPPMLLVKSHYVSTPSHSEEQNSTNPVDKIITSTQSIILSTSDAIKDKLTSFADSISTEVDTSSTSIPSTVSNKVHSETSFNNFTLPKTTVTTITEYITNAQTMVPMQEETNPPSLKKVETLEAEDNQKENHENKENQNIHIKPKNKFSNEENFQPYKPNRRRNLTKPETTTFLKKILG